MLDSNFSFVEMGQYISNRLVRIQDGSFVDFKPLFCPPPPFEFFVGSFKEDGDNGTRKKKGFNYFLLFPKVPSALGSPLSGHE